MSTVIRVALACFDMTAVQRWTSGLGLILLAMATAAIFMSGGPNDAQIVFGMSCFGVALILMMPAFGAGIGLRQASRPVMVHLRPHSRLLLLLGSMLAVVLFALVATVPSFLVKLFFAVRPFDPGTLRFPPPRVAFGFCWVMATVAFIYMFAMSRTVLGMMAFWLLPLALVQLLNYNEGLSDVISLWQLVAAAALAWIVFGAWYLRAGEIRPPVQNYSQSRTDGESSPFQWLLAGENARSDQPTRHTAIWHYLFGCASIRLYVITGLWIAAIFVVMQFFSPHGARRPRGQMLLMLPFISFFVATVAYNSARRARLLWLRAGLSRDTLFPLVEREALRAGLTTWIIVAATALTMATLEDPSRLPQLALYAAAQCVVALVAFYTGLSLVKTIRAGDILLCTFLGVLWVAQMAPGQQALRNDRLVIFSAGILVVAGVLAAVLRMHALRRWRGLDWRLIRPLNLASRRS